MADLKDVASTSQTAAKKKVGSFPRQPLKKILELSDAIYEEGHGDPVRRRTAFEKINRSPDSSTSNTLLQAANVGYSLVIGNKSSTHLELTDSGKNIAKAANPTEKLNAIHDLLYSNQFFSLILEKYRDRPLPSDEIVVDYLVREQNLTQSDAQSCWGVIKQNIFDYNLLEETGNKKIIIDREHALKINGSYSEDDSNSSSDNQSDDQVPPKSTVKEVFIQDESKVDGKPLKQHKSLKNLPQITFNIQVVLPENATPEVYEAIFSSMSTHLLGRDED